MQENGQTRGFSPLLKNNGINPLAITLAGQPQAQSKSG